MTIDFNKLSNDQLFEFMNSVVIIPSGYGDKVHRETFEVCRLGGIIKCQIEEIDKNQSWTLLMNIDDSSKISAWMNYVRNISEPMDISIPAIIHWWENDANRNQLDEPQSESGLLSLVASKLKDRVLFPKKVEDAKKYLQKVNRDNNPLIDPITIEHNNPNKLIGRKPKNPEMNLIQDAKVVSKLQFTGQNPDDSIHPWAKCQCANDSEVNELSKGSAQSQVIDG